MTFKVIPVDSVILYMRRAVESTTNPERRKNYKKLLNLLDDSRIRAFEGFENKHGERYIIIGIDLSRWWWAGDESDWETSSSIEEDIFVESLRQKALQKSREDCKEL